MTLYPSLSVSFYRAPFAACLFINSNFSRSQLRLEKIVNPFYGTTPCNSDIRSYQIRDLSAQTIKSGALLRCLLGFYRVQRNQSLRTYFADYLLIESSLQEFLDKSCKHIQLVDFNHIHQNSSGIFSFGPSSHCRLKSTEIQRLFMILQGSLYKNKSIFLGQPVVPSQDFCILFRISIGYRLLIDYFHVARLTSEICDILAHIDNVMSDL